jgi:hypothetical protein
MVTVTADSGEVRDDLSSRAAQIAAGTAWLWSRDDMASSVDVLLVDEAGQMSLANALPVSLASHCAQVLFHRGAPGTGCAGLHGRTVRLANLEPRLSATCPD